MRWFSYLFVLGLLFSPGVTFAQFIQDKSCASAHETDPPFPFGYKAPIPWKDMDGYWTDYGGTELFYRIEVQQVFQDGTRSVVVQVMNQMNEIVGTGVGIVRANSWDLWARVKGADLDLKIRIQAFYIKGEKDLSKRIIQASLRDMRVTATKCYTRQTLRKVDGLEVKATHQGGKKPTAGSHDS